MSETSTSPGIDVRFEASPSILNNMVRPLAFDFGRVKQNDNVLEIPVESAEHGYTARRLVVLEHGFHRRRVPRFFGSRLAYLGAAVLVRLSDVFPGLLPRCLPHPIDERLFIFTIAANLPVILISG
jgi:hypothetical protein